MKRVILASILIVSMMMVAGFVPIAAYAAPGNGDISTTSYANPLVGSDGASYYRTGVQTSIQYNKDGTTKSFVHENYSGPRAHYLIAPDGQGKYYGYCIEQGISYPDTQRYQGTSWMQDNYFSHLPKYVRTGIMLATIFGRQPGKSVPIKGCNDDDWYWATQVIIWEYQQQLRLSPTKILSNGYVSSTYFRSTLKGRPAEKCYNYMLAAMAKYQKIPSFASDSAAKAAVRTLKWDSSQSTWCLTLNDRNRISENLAYNCPAIQVQRTGTNYTFSTKTKTTLRTIEFKKKISLPSHELLIWGSATGTQSIATGTADPIKCYMKFRTEQPGTLILHKIAEEGVGSNFKFFLTDHNGVVTKCTTDPTGLINQQLYPGQYKVSEADTQKYRTPIIPTITITENKKTFIEVKNTLKKGRIQLQKNVKDTISNVINSENDAVFQLYDAKYKTFAAAPTSARDEIRTNPSGKAISKELPLGEYIVHQTKADKNITVSKDIKVTIDKDMEIVRLPLENYLQKGKIQILKTDQNHRRLEGAAFTVLAAEDILDYDGTVRFKKGSKIETIISDDKGVAGTNWLYPGKYSIQEINAPSGYLLSKNPLTEVMLAPGNQQKLTFMKQVVIENEAKEVFPRTGDNPLTSAGKAMGTLLLSLIGMALLVYHNREQNKTLH
jgi:hypothetical protein